MVYAWSAELETGNAAIDSQHKQLITAFNNLLEACAGGAGSEKLGQTLAFLVDYTAKHFADEESLQQRYNYPGYAEHKRMHDDFKKEVAVLAGKLKAEGPTSTLVIAVNRTIGQWLLKHIKTQDTKIAAHIRAVS